MRARLDAEVVSLFGRDIVEEAQGLDLAAVTAVQAKAVAVVAAQLKRFSGRPMDQRAFVANLERPIAMLLCRWLSDPETARAVVDATTQGTAPKTAPRTKPDGLVQTKGGKPR